MENLFFIASKLFWVAFQPESWLLLLLGACLWFLTRGRLLVARACIMIALGLILVVGFVPIGKLLIQPLEARFPAAPELLRPTAIIVMGGGEDARMSAASTLPELNDAGERLILGVALAQEFPEAKLIFTGGSGSLINQGFSGAHGAQILFRDFGIPDDRILLETKARNTAENASLSRGLVEDFTEGPWILVTSAFHMPRSIGAFCTAGWRNLVPYPVDYRAADPISFSWSFADNLALLNIAVKEWIGLAVYNATGRTPALLPNPC